MTDRESTLIVGRVQRFEQILGRPLPVPPTPPQPPLAEAERAHMVDAARDLYWNELEWEKITDEERMDEEFLTELAFPGFLAFIRGLLLSETMPDALAPPRPSPEVVRDILSFLGGRVVELEERSAELAGEDKEHSEAELQMTNRLIDLTLYQLHGLRPDEVASLEAAMVRH